ncbi:mechanosensitive ion channel [Alteromonadaceae bacterium M269]|nr:mechanosensitive ion channel [Alteromonadaceae bacterium M269]
MLEPEKISEMIDLYVIPWGINIVFALLIFIVGRMIVKVLVGVLGKLLAKSKHDSMLVDFVQAIVSAILTVFVVIAALDRLGVNTTSFAAILAAAGLAIGLSLQGSLQNFASGVMLLVFRPFKSGDYVEAGGTSGSVKSISIFTTTILTPDNKLILVPNGNIYGGNIVNYSAKETRRVDMVFGIGYGDDLLKAKKILEALTQEDERILADPAPQVAVSELGDSSVNFVVRPWVKSADYWGVKFDFTEAVKLRFDQEGISIPFPQMDVHVHKEGSAD